MRLTPAFLSLCLACSSATPQTMPTPSKTEATPLQNQQQQAPTKAEPTHSVFSFIDNRLSAHREERGPYLWFGSPEPLHSIRSSMLSLNEEVAGARAAKLLSSTLSLSLYVAPSKQALNELRVKFYNEASSGSLTLSLQGKSLGARPLIAGWQVVKFPVSALTPGDNTIQITATATKGAISWLHVTESSAKEIDPKELRCDLDSSCALRLAQGTAQGNGDDKQKPALSVAPQGAVSFFMMPPAGSVLSSSVKSLGGACTISVLAQSDTVGEKELAKIEASSGWSESQISLTEFADAATRLTFSARDCADGVLWEDPRVAVSGEAPRAKVESPVKRVIFWVIDTQRADSYDFYNPKTRVATPNYSKFVKSATLFERCYSGGNESQAGGASMHTSTYPAVHKVFQEKNKLALTFTTLAEAMTAAGFKTYGYSANGYISPSWNYQQGFNEFISLLHAKLPDDAGYIWSRGKQILEKYPNDKLFLYLHTTEPHVPYSANKGLIEKYDVKNYRGRYPYAVTGNETGAIRGGKLILTQEEREHVRALYDNEVEFSDKYFGKMIEDLDKGGYLKDTMIVVTADHGEDMFEQGEKRIGHGRSLFEPVLWIPCIIYAPGLYPAGKRVSVSAEHIDLMPSILDAVGGEIPSGAQGESLLLLANTETSYARPAISSWFNNQYALTIGLHKWVHKNRFEGDLYDLKNFPDEKTISTKDQPITARYLQEMMLLYFPFQATWSKRSWGVPSNVTDVFVKEASKAPIRL